MKDRYYFITKRREYRVGRYNSVELTKKEVERETFIERLEYLTKEEYERLMSGSIVCRGCYIFTIKSRFEMLREKALCESGVKRNGHNYNRANKIAEEIKNGKINKDNLYKKVKTMTRKVKSEQALSDWTKIVDWFASAEW